MPPFRVIRIVLLLGLLLFAAFYTKQQQLNSRSWSKPVAVVIYPINHDRSASIDTYISTLNVRVFSDIGHFLRRESQKFDIAASQPAIIRLGSEIKVLPPEPPQHDRDYLANIWWSLKFRYWAFRHTPDDASNLNRIRVFLLYHEPLPERRLRHSVGLDKGLLAVVHAFAAERQNDQNNIVIAHELLHTVGATDKYDKNLQPVYPDGYADPLQKPLYPQHQAEIMAARIPTSPSTAYLAENRAQCVIGPKTALEINWARRIEYIN